MSVHDILAFLSDFDGLPDPLCCLIRFPADNCRRFLVDEVTGRPRRHERRRGGFLSSHVYYNLLLSAATTLAESSGNGYCRNVTNFLVNNLGCFSIIFQQLRFVSTDCHHIRQ